MAWKALVSMVTICLIVHQVVCKPLNKRGPAPPEPVEKGSQADENMGTGLEYDHYLRQIVEILESDDGFRKKLETANISDIKSGAIAMHLELVNNTIRTKLDEIKRLEVQRLQELARIKMRSMSGVNRMDIPGHLDLRNPHSFEMKDLEHLIKKTTHDLEEVDKKRREEFKNYEMEKEYEYQEQLKHMSEDEKKKTEEQHEALKKKHKEHEKINHPGSKDQFEEVWEKEDHLEDQDFDPKTFFMKHDLNGDRMWDVQEVEAVLQRELDKVYDARNAPEEDDPMERFEEMNRMREHVFTEIDKDKDFMITIDEFMEYTGKHGENEKFKEDEGWETLDEKPAFSDNELQEYIRQHHVQPGMVPPPVDNNLQFAPEEQLRQQQLHQQQQLQQQQQLHQQQQVSKPTVQPTPSPVPPKQPTPDLQQMGQQGIQQPGMGVPAQGFQPPQGQPAAQGGVQQQGGVPQNNIQQQQQLNQQQLNLQQQQFAQQQQFNQQQQQLQQQQQQQQLHQQQQQVIQDESQKLSEQQQQNIEQQQIHEQKHQPQVEQNQFDNQQQQQEHIIELDKFNQHLFQQANEQIDQRQIAGEQEQPQQLLKDNIEQQQEQVKPQEDSEQQRQQDQLHLNQENIEQQPLHQENVAEGLQYQLNVEPQEQLQQQQQQNQINQGQPVHNQPGQPAVQGHPVQDQGQPAQGQVPQAQHQVPVA